MKTQQDTKIRMVALENLKAMCERQSGTMCHKFWVEKVTRSRVWVGYSNENEYAVANPMFAIYPCFPSPWPDDQENPRVLLDMLRVVNDTWDGEGWQAFYPIADCPQLWRDPAGESWSTKEEI